MVSEDRNDDRRLEYSSSHRPPAVFPAPAFNADFKFDYTADPMDVNASQQGLYAANSLVRQRLKERIQNGDIDEIEAERRREKKRISARNSRARRKAMREAQEQEDSIMSNDPVRLSGPVAHPSGETTPVPGDFLIYFPDRSPPTGSYSSTTFHEILAKANSASSDSAGVNFQHYEPESASAPVRLPSTSIPSAPAPPTPLPSATLEPATFPSASVQSTSLPPASFPSASVPSVSLPPASFPSVPVPSVSLPPASFPSAPVLSVSLLPASFPSAPVPSVPVPSAPIPSVSLLSGHLPHDPLPIFKSRNFSDAIIMTDPLPEPPKESEPPLDPLRPTLARHPHRQLTPERLLEFQANPLDLIDKAFLLIVPDADSSFGKLVLCRVIELQVSGREHRFLVQFWGEKTLSEIGVARILRLLVLGLKTRG
ncbi:hypothetical protein M405DRAFT_861706 [Rhizopogon salebrosus TDB-379]|nr:hypothetical protein M405DRAFT_861706 [Rhizopogon salebrosus TDB-379]